MWNAGGRCAGHQGGRGVAGEGHALVRGRWKWKSKNKIRVRGESGVRDDGGLQIPVFNFVGRWPS